MAQSADGIPDLETLQQKGQVWQAKERGWRIYYALFSRSGFRQPLVARAKNNPDLLLFDPEIVVLAGT